MVRTSELFRFYPDREIYPSKFGQNLQLLLPLTYKKECGYINKPHMNYIQQEQSLSQTKDLSQKKLRTIMNAEGFLDIRLHLIDQIISGAEENVFAKNMAYRGHWYNIMLFAHYSSDIILMQEAFAEYKKYTVPSVEDKILYYDITNKYLHWFYRIQRLLFGKTNKDRKKE